MGKNQSSSNLTNIIQQDANGGIAFMSGSTMLMALSNTGQMSGSVPVLAAATASFVQNAQSASFAALAQSASNAVSAATASFVALAQSASNAVSAQTASFANTFTVNSTLTAQTLVVQTITSSVDFVTGSTRFGSIADNTHIFTGSVYMNSGGLFVSSSGFVGIGTNSPATLLEVVNPTLATDTVNTLLTQRWSRKQTGAVKWGNSIDLLLGSYESGTINSRSRVDFRLANGATDTPDTTVITLQGNGNVGIGTNAPSSTFHVRGTFGAPSTSGNSLNGFARFGQTSGNGGLDIGFGDPYSWLQSRNATDYSVNYNLSLNPNGGNVGIGTITPNYPLHVYKSSGISTINVESISGQNSQYRMEEAGAVKFAITYVPSDSTTRMYFAGHGSDLITLKGSNFGIGTTSPYSRLDVRGAIAMGSGATYPLNAKFVKQGSTSVTFTATLGTIGAWRPGHAMIKVSGGQNGLQEYWAAWFYVRIIAYVASSVICTVVDSGGETGSVSFSSTSNTSSPQTVTFTLTDNGTTTDTIIADIDLTYNEGIVSLS
jgi:hypothetical protein